MTRRPTTDAGELDVSEDGGSPPFRTSLLLTLALLAAFAPIATDLYLPGFPAIGDDLGSAASGVQLTLTAFLIGLACGQLVMGPLSDRFGRRPPLVVSAAVCVVAGVVVRDGAEPAGAGGGPAGAGLRRRRAAWSSAAP